MDVPFLRQPPYSYPELADLSLDGLITQVTEDCWVPAGTRMNPHIKAAALLPMPMSDVLVSHGTAHWVWWGSGRAPWQLEFTTRKRRRIRGHVPFTVYERTVPADGFVTLAGAAITTPVRTLYDELFAVCAHADDSQDIDHQLIRQVERIFLGVDHASQQGLQDYLAGLAPRPYLARMRTCLSQLSAANSARDPVYVEYPVDFTHGR